MTWILVIYMAHGPFSLPIYFRSPEACERAWDSLVLQDPARFDNGKATYHCYKVNKY